MKRFIIRFCQRITGIKLMMLAASILSFEVINAQEKQSVTGKLTGEKSCQAVPYAAVALSRTSDSTLIRSTVSDENGLFTIGQVPEGKYKLLVSFIGYNTVTKIIDVVNKGRTDTVIISLQEKAIALEEAVVVGDRLKAKSENGKTTFLITQKMLDASSTGTDLLQLIPAIKIDLMQNISLEGSQNILITVDGKERDKNFISQLDPKQIDKVEIIGQPSSNYDGNITGVINIILKKERDSGFSGHIYAEIPCSGSEIYIFPTYSLNYGSKKWNFYTSYNGELTYLNLHESTIRKAWNSTGSIEINSDQYVRQKYWSHRFHYGFDYFLSPHDLLNFYAYYNPFSRELDGSASAQISGRINNNWQAKREDTNINAGSYYSLYYKHTFGKEGHEFTSEVTNCTLKAQNSTDYIYEGPETGAVTQTNGVKPQQYSTSIRMDYAAPFSNKLTLSAGVKARFEELQNRYSENFDYYQKILAAYGTISYKQLKYDLSIGLRTEKSVSDLKNQFSKSVLSVLPNAAFRYKLSSLQNLQLSFSSSVNRPDDYQLIPFTFMDDPYTVSKGNPLLRHELRSSLFLEHSIQFKSNYFSTRLFYYRTADAISNLICVNDTGAFEIQPNILGTIHKYGVQFLGTFKLGCVTLNPYLRMFELYTSCNSFAIQHGVGNRHEPAFESGLSAVLSFKKDLALSMIFQYSSPQNNIQDNSFSDALYFISLEKTFKHKFKAGIASGIPFVKSFVYRGSETNAANFSSRYEGTAKMSTIPLWFKVSYQFNSGNKKDRINRANDEIDNLPRKGF